MEFGMKKAIMIILCSIDNQIQMAVYMDNIVITDSDNLNISKLKNFLQATFQTKDLGVLCYFLGIKIAQNKKDILVTMKICS